MSDNKLVSITGGKKESKPLLNYIKITYTDGEIEVLQSDSWGDAQELDGYLVFFRTLSKDEDMLIGFRNRAVIKKLEMVNEDGTNV